VSTYHFQALGTAWSLTVDQAGFVFDSVEGQKVIDKVIAETTSFETRFSRFKDGSESRQFTDAKPGVYPISSQMCALLKVADQLRQLTRGAYDPAVGGLMEAAGYTPDYSLQPNEKSIQTWRLPSWNIDEVKQSVTIDGPLLFDFGGMGKGFWIDQLSQILLDHGLKHHLVEGGGDMFATTKADGSAWKVAIEYPGKTEMAIGTYALFNQGMAASDVFRRRWGQWHHFVDVTLKQPTTHIVGCVAVSSSAWKADQITSVLALTHPELFSEVVPQIGGEYVVLFANGEAKISSNWHGVLF
jgi:thiamine biosynthesis lipoprotein